MAGDYPEITAALAAPFDDGEIKRREQGGKILHYITARTAMNRLDNVLGSENWSDDYTPQGNAILCSITVTYPNGRTVTKRDAGGFAGMKSEEDNVKSAYSDAFKRAAAKFGVGRYFYGDGVPYCSDGGQATTHDDGDLPREHVGVDIPENGKQLYAVVRKAEERLGTQILGAINKAAKELGITGRTIDWTTKQVERVWPIAERLINIDPEAKR